MSRELEYREFLEAEANYFAMCLLMPEHLVRPAVAELGGSLDLATGGNVEQLAEKFAVSPALMTVRLTDLYGKLI